MGKRDLPWLVSYVILVISLILMFREFVIILLVSSILLFMAFLSRLFNTDLISLGYLLLVIFITIYLLVVKYPYLEFQHLYYILILSFIIYLLVEFSVTSMAINTRDKIYEILIILLLIIPTPLISWLATERLIVLLNLSREFSFSIGLLVSLSVYLSMYILIKSDIKSLSFFYEIVARDLYTLQRSLIILERGITILLILVSLAINYTSLFILLVLGEIARYSVRRVLKIEDKYATLTDLISPLLALLYLEITRALM
ncbi:MAG: hypothetical protein ABWJ42_02695 [Sulfolobales archaeon]